MFPVDPGMTLAERLRVALGDGAPPDLILHDGLEFDHGMPLTEAAVLIAVTDRPEPGVILTKRPDTMRKHPGQVAFPGGRMDADDADVFATALREAEEEIGLSPSLVEIVGTTDPYLTITAYRVTPVMAVIPPDLPFAANDGEVEAIFEVPLGFLLDQANHQMRRVEWQGGERHYWEMHHGGQRIWGATAAMIVNLSRRLRWPL